MYTSVGIYVYFYIHTYLYRHFSLNHLKVNYRPDISPQHALPKNKDNFLKNTKPFLYLRNLP